MRILVELKSDGHRKSRICQTDFPDALREGNQKEVPHGWITRGLDRLHDTLKLAYDVRVKPFPKVHNIRRLFLWRVANSVQQRLGRAS
jgi:hypothetical protein